MIKITRWKPDTCDCIIDYQWDDQSDENNRVHTVSNVVARCSAHQALTTIVDVYNAVRDENSRKNIIYGQIIKNLSSAVEEVIQEDGSRIKRLKSGRDYKWSFDKDRNLVIDLVGFVQQEKDVISSLVSSEFGSKVIIK